MILDKTLNYYNNKKEFDRIFKLMLNDQVYSKFMTYALLLSQCNILITEDKPQKTSIAVDFKVYQYNVYINMTNFKKLSDEHKIGALTHTALHILNKHVFRSTLYSKVNFKIFSIACDIAINQFIPKKYLPSDSNTLEMLNSDLICKCGNSTVVAKKLESAEYYYEFILKHFKPEVSGNGDNSGILSFNTDKNTDDHNTWKDFTGDESVLNSVTSRILDRAKAHTCNKRGTVPAAINGVELLFVNTAKISWSEQLKSLAANKKIGKKYTIMRKNRRFPNRKDLLGAVKNRTMDFCVFLDVSGSMVDYKSALAEIKEISRILNTSLKVIQIDTKVQAVEDLNISTVSITRKGCGGTIIEPAMDYIKKHKINADVVILVSDMMIDNISNWKNKPDNLFLLSTTGLTPPGLAEYGGCYRFYNIDDI